MFHAGGGHFIFHALLRFTLRDRAERYDTAETTLIGFNTVKY